MAQLMPLPLTISCFNKIQIGPGEKAVKRMRVCVVILICIHVIFLQFFFLVDSSQTSVDR